MISNLKIQLASALAMTSLLAACASKPPNMHSLDANADASRELEVTQQMMNEAKSKNVDALAPKNFERAEESLADARKSLVKGKNKEKVLEEVAEARAWLTEAENKSEVVRTASSGISEARSGAIQAQAQDLYPKEFKKIEDQTLDVTRDAERGNLKPLNKYSAELEKEYKALEVKSVEKSFLGESQLNMATAKKENSEKAAPKTYKMAQDRFDQAKALIEKNPKDKDAIAKASARSNEMTQFLLTVTQKVKEGNTEDLVLQTERQRRTISGLNEDYASTEKSLANTQANLAQTNAALEAKNNVLQTAEKIRSQLKPTEAEVFVEGNAVKVRLKGLQFASSRTNLSPKSAALLEKVDQAIESVGVNKITVEGHTDSVGTAETNQALSEKRAQTVQDYILSKGKIDSEKVSYVGKGSEEPISDNRSARGRSENRRIDLVIEPSSPQAAPSSIE